MATSGNVAADPMTPPSKRSAKSNVVSGGWRNRTPIYLAKIRRRSQNRADKGYASGSDWDFR